MTETSTSKELELVEETFQRIATDLAMIADRQMSVASAQVERATKRAVGRGKVHISFKLAFQLDGTSRYGCLLMPLPDAIAVACYLMMIPDDGVKAKRTLQTLDSSLKDALMEVSNFIGGATDSALRALGHKKLKVSSAGCQGVKADVRPALLYHEGDPLLIGRTTAKLHEFPEFELVLMLPELPAPEG